ncbi:DUF4124 domain-containing protein [Spongiibacter sp. UBA1325]|uniref:DUF4124 domain-containing protein n=1 Tax=Spongiibacter sp. UBA1325 TaxID=1947543 RepID=UPI00257B86B0|nr:DUF4124 domain-containing protein [Spongiibacter sp. UBA1325]|tara:strand:- start:27165 stop:27674 length:510 start_codon:yes stop_codon:yes gene_type:complete
MRYLIAAHIFLIALATPAYTAEIYKCIDANGRPIFSQMPCGRDAEKTTITPPDEIGSVSTDRNSLQALKQSNRLRDIERDIAAENRRIRSLQRRMDIELEKLRQKKNLAKNNLAGAQWEQSISAEMSSVVERYNAKISAANLGVSRLEGERDRLIRANKDPHKGTSPAK